MTSQSSLDAYAASVLANIDPKVRASLTDEQVQAIGRALATRHGKGAHLLDTRGLIKTYFATYYYVLQFGRDRRMGRRRTDYERGMKARMLGNVIFFLMAISPLILLGLVGLYFLKAALGVDLIPDFHTPSLFGLGR
ncbi:MAG TPA: hypothetical protein PLL19_00750 [Thiobacillaceae bacterium]|nr:hypothetical protein [Thiobacillaceae bacterium]HNF87826.1 hypothetical protein [Thiobacillaceae bacterium]HNH87778.1 hypothetical protein [Thiobacillaceae bacterium]HNI06507.1 hypothetical protein [Thiobacillaceae bacterium]